MQRSTLCESSRCKNTKRKVKTVISSCSHSVSSLFIAHSFAYLLSVSFLSIIWTQFFISFCFDLFFLVRLSFRSLWSCECFVCLLSADCEDRKEAAKNEIWNERSRQKNSETRMRTEVSDWLDCIRIHFQYLHAMQCCWIRCWRAWCWLNNYNQWLLHRWPWHFAAHCSLLRCWLLFGGRFFTSISDANGFSVTKFVYRSSWTHWKIHWFRSAHCMCLLLLDSHAIHNHLVY